MEPPPGSGSLNPESGRYERDNCYWDGTTWRSLDGVKKKATTRWPLTMPQSVIAGAALVGMLLFGVALGSAGEDENSARATQTTTRTLQPSPTGNPGMGQTDQSNTTPAAPPRRTPAPATTPDAAAIEANRVAMESRQAAVDAQATRLERPSYPAIGEREYSILARNPDAEKGRRVVVYGHVTQFDSVTGSSMFRADTSAVKGNQWYDYDLNTIVTFDPASAREVINGDIVTLYAEVAGSRSYTTTFGATESAVVLKANIIDIAN